ncbi:hypothetical protein GYMLUDRAFT_64815 [Collybiopsis luxurians FD-317 M1]|uniref:Uncharacterized protein n=1 Tax=Collybiopsis luxurians FD-317 M1 TaxID=944289 RepID=A0A0D0AMH6_9AGAR|nr:hypothetical protein GYMLUDRAFT_64815 [Collybiopsis luxurians FD-317 M1]
MKFKELKFESKLSKLWRRLSRDTEKKKFRKQKQSLNSVSRSGSFPPDIPLNHSNLPFSHIKQLDAAEREPLGNDESDRDIGSEYGKTLDSDEIGNQEEKEDEQRTRRTRREWSVEVDSVNEELSLVPRKKKRIDPAGYKWNIANHLNETVYAITIAHMNVQKQVQMYAEDIKQAVRSLDVALDKPSLPKSQWKNILVDGYVEFDEIVTSMFSVEQMDPEFFTVGESQIEFRKLKPIAKVTSQESWIHAYSIYKDAVNFAFVRCNYELET